MSNNNTTKKSSTPWILSWLSQLTNKSTDNGIVKNTATQPLPVLTNTQQQNNNTTIMVPRPSITISLSSERRNSQQTMSTGSFTSDASYYQRRDSSERSTILSDLWLKARKRKLHKQQELSSSYRPPGIDYKKRYSTSSSPSVSRPNSILVSQPNSPHLYLNNYQDFILDDDDIDTYWLNNDDYYDDPLYPKKKKERWTIKHELVKLAVDGLFAYDELVALSSSVEKYVLQIGCGDGLWGIDIAIQNPKWMVIGIDDDKQQQLTTRMTVIPRNFKFIKCQFLKQALSSFSDASFDLISTRFLMMENTRQQYQDILKESLRLCKPNGYIEVMELDMRIYQQKLISITTTQLLNNKVMLALENESLDPRLARHLEDLIEKNTSISCKSKYISLPLGVWGGRLGVMFRDDIHQLYEKIILLSDNNEAAAFEYKLELLDNELEANRAFMNLHVMLINKKESRSI